MLTRILTTLVISTFLSMLPGFAAGQSRNLQSESQQELLRVFGTAGRQANDLSPTESRVLSQQSIDEFRRVFGVNSLQGSIQLQGVSTPATIDSTILTTVLASNDPRRYVILWHLIAIDLTAVDHRAVIGASPTTFHEQFGPARAARAMALIHQAIFEAINVFERKYESALPGVASLTTGGASPDAAVVEAAYQVAIWLYPGLSETPPTDISDPNQICSLPRFNLAVYYACSLDSITDVAQRNAGVALGRAIADKIIGPHSRDGAERPEPVWGRDFIPRQAPGGPDYPLTQWQRDPVSQLNTALGGLWGTVRPFALTSGFQFRPTENRSPIKLVRDLIAKGGTAPDAYRMLPSYNAVNQWGRETRLDPTGRQTAPPPSGDGFFIAQLWAYDGTADLCAPVRLYNQMATAVLHQLELNAADGYQGVIDPKSPVDVARFYALINIAMADAAVAGWDAKFYFQFPRPVTYIRAVDAATNPPGSPQWFPVGAQNTNSDQPFNISPPFPAYPSGHAVFGGALTGVLRQFMRPTAQFSFLSDEFNGKNRDVYNYIRCSPQDTFTPAGSKFCAPRSFTLDCAERENADSRVFMGVHWVFDADDGLAMGNKVAKQVYHTLMKPMANGQPQTPPSQMFSVDPATATTRSALLCPGITLPAGWDDLDPTKGFGPLVVERVDAL